MLPMAVMAAASMVSYERARAESLGFTARGGLMERAERMIALGACLVFSSLMVPILWLMLALTLFTAGHRFVMVWRQASTARPERPVRTKPTLAGVAGRWRGWTPGASSGPSPRGAERVRWGTGTARDLRPDGSRRRPPRPRP
jgi:CDP-diacylglycerol--glycerol-3-phosphate 3-phosphatidyltransferase